MTEIPARDLRNDVSSVLRRVEQGESLTVAVSGRPVARLVPLPTRPGTMPWSILASILSKVSADIELGDQLATVLPDTTSDLA
ncbi:MAG: type II toxin-antitoxin system prevent-host-death family antitoxin [Acidimicrobiia bacterium]